MIDPELKAELEKINIYLSEIQRKNAGFGMWRSFFSGIMSALGYMVGLAIVIVILGWVLQRTGLLPAFKQEMQNFADVIDQAKKLTAPAGNNQPANNSSTSGGESVITLPNGQQYHINVSR